MDIGHLDVFFLLQLGVDQGTAGQAVVMMKVGWSAIEF